MPVKNKTMSEIIKDRRDILYNKLKRLFLAPGQKKYADIAELPNLWEYETIFQIIMGCWLISKEKKEDYDALIEMDGDRSSELISLKPLKDLNILEIGGYFVLNLGELGANTVMKDSTIDSNDFITIENFKEKLKEDYFDITFSKEVLDRFSGVDADKDFETAAKELLTVFSKVTKINGMSLHEGHMPEIASDKSFLDKIGFELVSVFEGKRIGPEYDVYVFRKI